MKTRLAPELKTMVRAMGGALGRAVEHAEGRALYLTIEGVRRRMVAFRDGRGKAKRRALKDAQRVLAALPPAQRTKVAKAYTLYLELVNACENAYRTRRLRARPTRAEKGSRLTFVLTSHPTESRSPDNIRLLRRVQDELIGGLDAGATDAVARVEPLLRLLWRVNTHPPHKPRPEDEAAHLYSLLSDRLLGEFLRLRAEGHDLRLRTWVGGDRDGHPGVGPGQLRASLNLSRARLSEYLRARLSEALVDAAALEGPSFARVSDAQSALDEMRVVRAGDGARRRSLVAALDRATASYRAVVGAEHPSLAAAHGLLQLFPGLVVPLELRDEAGSFGLRGAVAGLFAAVRDISRGGHARDYAQGCVVSRVEAPRDVLEALRALRRVFLDDAPPVIALFETPQALENAVSVLDGCWKDASFRRSVRGRDSRLEVMLGYSDSAKRMGALPSREAIRRAMNAISRWAAARRLTPIFFHGSGGSAGRGGGTVEEQAATWPARSRGLVKLTLQGEMIERTFATPEILRSTVAHWARAQNRPPASGRAHPLTRRFSAIAQTEFARLVNDPGLVELLRAATPYPRLSALHIGSRPFARKSEAGLEGVRAIPWVLCWTQTRILLPAWYGVGAAWTGLRAQGVRPVELRAALAEDPLLRSYVRQLDFTLAKCEPLIWEEYVRRLASPKTRPVVEAIAREYEACVRFLRAASQGTALGDRAWLKDSIYYRAPMIHPLNLLQIEALAQPRPSEQRELLFRETVTGIAAGMMTTG